MRRLIHLSLMLGAISLLPGCLLLFLLAPKTTPASLPGPDEIRPLKQVYVQHCGRCHALIDPVYFNPDRPIQHYTNRYIAQGLMHEREAQQVITYLQALAAFQP